MITLYNLAIRVIALGYRIAAPFHAKAGQFVRGRKGLIKLIQETFSGNTLPVIWMHCASVGEFEQGRPVLEKLRKEFPQHKLVLTFFSPSGYELRKTYSGVDHVFYLPWDTPSNAAKFVNAVNPRLAIFVKYEFWLHYSEILKRKGIPLLSISSIFREDQRFFKKGSAYYQRILRNFSFFFVQNDQSVRLLKSININNCFKAGDTRFDRVYQIVEKAERIPIAEKFKAGEKLMVVGSCWHEDFDILLPLINESRLKFIIAPHEISESFIASIEKMLQVKSIRYSAASNVDLDDYLVLIVDNIGLLSKLYRYGEFAFVGGAYGKGLHNILEAACYGIPVLFGNRNFEKFREAVDLINLGGAFEIADYPDLKTKYEMLNIPENFMLACEVTRQYVEGNLGATEKIMEYCRNVLK
jgi:3-deoxy-D-manno-octulosonic-acid transferase